MAVESCQNSAPTSSSPVLRPKNANSCCHWLKVLSATIPSHMPPKPMSRGGMSEKTAPIGHANVKASLNSNTYAIVFTMAVTTNTVLAGGKWAAGFCRRDWSGTA